MSYYRSIFHFDGILQGTNFNQKAGVQGFDDTTSIFGFPEITLTNYATYLGSPSNQLPKSNQHRNLQFNLSSTYSHGSHSIKFGEIFITSAPALSMAPIRQGFLRSAASIRATRLLTSCWAFPTMSRATTISS